MEKQQKWAQLLEDFCRCRAQTELLVTSLSEADAQMQSMPDASPSKWHLAHTSWFFETFILMPADSAYVAYNVQFQYLFNSYYNGVGEQYPRATRGLISRPSLAEIIDYRHHVSAQIHSLFSDGACEGMLVLLELGIHHEQQHQELLLMDIKHGLFQNPCYPAYSDHLNPVSTPVPKLTWCDIPAGTYDIGCDSADGRFCFDNEEPRHRVLLSEYRLANRLVSNGEYLEFIEDGGYRDPQLWLADGWAEVQAHGRNAPYYWQFSESQGWCEYQLNGLHALDVNQPLCHVSFYEANAYATWAQSRLPTEQEWEVALSHYPAVTTECDLNVLRPRATAATGEPQILCELWQWTTSSYQAYPKFKPFSGLAGEYNGKFMANQYVLRGGSYATPSGHLRTSYRNFFYPHQFWAFSGIRLARDI